MEIVGWLVIICGFFEPKFWQSLTMVAVGAAIVLASRAIDRWREPR